MTGLRGHRCDRAHEWVSLRVDGELSELECRLLDDHLARCDDCSEFASDVAHQSLALRAAPLVPFRVSVTLPRRRRVPVRSLQLAAAALVTTALVLGSLSLVSHPTGGGLVEPRIVSPKTPDDFVGTNIARRAKLIAESPHFWAGPRGFQLT
jgi:predicted anti-sigma-YlaC factor YlaD